MPSPQVGKARAQKKKKAVNKTKFYSRETPPIATRHIPLPSPLLVPPRSAFTVVYSRRIPKTRATFVAAAARPRVRRQWRRRRDVITRPPEPASAVHFARVWYCCFRASDHRASSGVRRARTQSGKANRQRVRNRILSFKCRT